ncbi:MAG: nuclear transport factor 2 family protein [Deltaproteobacteria bacterium]|nr:nuclear transport factor 2 family protein [Deltaproteobacteria bacterium]
MKPLAKAALCMKILAVLSLLPLVLQGCVGTGGKLEFFLEKPRIEKAVDRYFSAEIKGDFKGIYDCLAPSSIYCSTHTYGEYLEQVQGSSVRIKDYHILNIHDLRGNHDKVKYPKIEKFVRVEVDVTLLYGDTDETLEVNQEFTFIKEGGKWYKG